MTFLFAQSGRCHMWARGSIFCLGLCSFPPSAIPSLNLFGAAQDKPEVVID